jgi:hypothetical protein
MKKSKLKYRLTTCKNNKEVVQDLDLKGLYKQTVRKKWQKIYEHTKTYSNEVDRSNISCIVDTLLFQET